MGFYQELQSYYGFSDEWERLGLEQPERGALSAAFGPSGSPEDALPSAGMDTSELIRKTRFASDDDRQSGRTTRLLGRAFDRAQRGQEVFFVVRDGATADHALKLLTEHYRAPNHVRITQRGWLIVYPAARGDIEIVLPNTITLADEGWKVIFDHDTELALGFSGVPNFTGGGDWFDVETHKARYLNDGGRAARIDAEQRERLEEQRTALEKHREAVAARLQRMQVEAIAKEAERVGDWFNGAGDEREWFFKELRPSAGQQVKVPPNFKFPEVPIHLTQPARSFLITNVLPQEKKLTAAEAHAQEVERAKQWMKAHEDPNKRDTFE